MLAAPDHDRLKTYRDLRMPKTRFTYWQDGDLWIGYLNEYPDYMTQGEDLDELKEGLRSLHEDLTSGEIPRVRRVAELEVP
jgi:predicted RNase H-like HicB family nuclease